jgi:tartrate-resistant acid phosphatase type 5
MSKEGGALLKLSGCAAVFLLTTVSQIPAFAQPQGAAASPPPSVRFAVIGDYGLAGQPELDVANLVKSWAPDLIITTGDNNYPLGEQSTVDQNIGQYYHDFIYPSAGGYGAGASENRFFPALGNHDWYTGGAVPYLNYFALPGNERYYDFARGQVRFFAVDSDDNEPDGNSSSSRQAAWLQSRLANSCATWNIVYLHHAPFSSGTGHGSTAQMQWPYAEWGASAVLAGHDHTYERILQDGIPYFVDGLGGASIYTFTTTPVPGSQVRYNADYGAMLVDADGLSITFKFVARSGTLVDALTLNAVTPGTCRAYFPIVQK